MGATSTWPSPTQRGRAAGVCLRERDGLVAGEVFGSGAVDWVRSQVERILSLDVDGAGFAEVGRRDPTIGALQQRFAGLRPVLFMSPYEAAAWALIANRLRIAQAARIKARMAEQLGAPVDVHGDVRHAFPGPARLGDLADFPGLSERKLERLRALAAAAREGALDPSRLRALPPEDALSELRQLPGIGPFGAELILLRGAGEPDHLPMAEPRLRRAVGLAYGLEGEPPQDELVRLSEAWRPYRTWVTVLLRASLENET